MRRVSLSRTSLSQARVLQSRHSLRYLVPVSAGPAFGPAHPSRRTRVPAAPTPSDARSARDAHVGPHGLQTRLIHAAEAANQTPAVAPPIFQTSTYRLRTPEEGAELASAIAPATFYTRYGSPNEKQVEALLAELEGT